MAAQSFISPKTNVDNNHPDILRFADMSKEAIIERWKTDDGKRIKEELIISKFNAAKMESIVGKFYGQFDLRGIDLSETDLSSLHLQNIDFYAATLKKVNFNGSNLSNCYFSEANICGTDLSWSKLSKSFFDNAKFDKDTTLIGVDLNSINSNLAFLLIDQGQIQQRIAHLDERHPVFSFFLKWSSDYGRSFGRWLAWALSIILVYALAYTFLPNAVSFSDGSSLKGILDGVYFSIVTFTTLGYGDISPSNYCGQILVISEVIIGYIMGGLLIALLARRVVI